MIGKLYSDFGVCDNECSGYREGASVDFYFHGDKENKTTAIKYRLKWRRYTEDCDNLLSLNGSYGIHRLLCI